MPFLLLFFVVHIFLFTGNLVHKRAKRTIIGKNVSGSSLSFIVSEELQVQAVTSLAKKKIVIEFFLRIVLFLLFYR